MHTAIKLATIVTVTSMVYACVSSTNAPPSDDGGSSSGSTSGSSSGSSGGSSSGSSTGSSGGSSSGGSSSGSGSGSGSGSSSSGGDAGYVCPTPPADTAPAITSTAGTGTAPTNGAGGTIESGTYFLTSYTIYPGSTDTAGSQQQTEVIDATKLTVTGVGATPDGPLFLSGTYTTSGTTITSIIYCSLIPDGGIVSFQDGVPNAPFSYTYAAGALTFFSNGSVLVYTKQ